MRAPLALALAMIIPLDLRSEESKGIAFFESRIRPVLIQHCLACHSAEAAKAGKLKGGLFLDTREGIIKGGESGPAVVPGKTSEGLLLKSMRHASDAPRMPPSGKLPGAVVADFEAWIKMGAPDPRKGAPSAVKKGLGIEEGRRFWSMIPPAMPKVPMVARTDWPRGDVDRFVQAAREAKGIDPAGDADRRTLARRVSFDLVGLPPEPALVEEFASDPDPSAYERLVDKLLASSHFGEHWGRHWLDAARYADSNGRDRNIFWFHAWRYRDHVIDSFNMDVPYDRFLREQVAGDLLPAGDPRLADRQRIATGFLAMGPKAFEESKPDVFRMDVIDEQIEVIGRSILGLSIGCARCHDHKFDPIPTRDYYAIAGILGGTETLYGHGTRGIKATAFHNTALQPVGPDAPRLAKAGQEYFDTLQALTLKQNTARSDRYRVVRQLSDAKVQLAKPGADGAKLQPEIDRLNALIGEWDKKVKAAEAELSDWQDHAPEMPGWAMAARDKPAPGNCRIHVRGEVTNLGEEVPRGVLQVLPNPAGRIPASASGRLELADWLASADNPLTARVYVNRVWQHLFGQGLVTTPDDFGVNGSRPSHPQLLDYLALRFIGLGWSTKKLVRELVTSRAYRLSSQPVSASLAADPENTLVWRMSPRRLDAESLRDAILVVGGRLNPARPSTEILAAVHPFRHGEFTTFKPQFGQELYDSPHRGVYLPVIRGLPPEMFQLFDFPSAERPTSRREESTVPAQALFFMNSPWVISESRRAAASLLSNPTREDAPLVIQLFGRAFSRKPTQDELKQALAYLSGRSDAASTGPGHAGKAEADTRSERWTSLVQAILGSAEFRTLR